MDLLDGSLVKTPHRRPLVENALKRYVLYAIYTLFIQEESAFGRSTGGKPFCGFSGETDSILHGEFLSLC